jgi:choline dehydrogenase
MSARRVKNRAPGSKPAFGLRRTVGQVLIDNESQGLAVDDLAPVYDFIVCGCGSSGSVVAARLANDPAATVLVLEAGGSADDPAVTDPARWPLNLGSERDWAFSSEPNCHLNGRSVPLNMGKVLGGGSSINVMAWARGHESDWNQFAAAAGEPAWNYESVLEIYRRIEDWQGAVDPHRRGVGGPVFVEPARDPSPIALALIDGARSIGIPTYDSHNGSMMERAGGASIVDVRIRDGVRQSVFGSYVEPRLELPNLTVITRATVSRLTFSGNRATGVEFSYAGSVHRVSAAREVVVSLGAINTPKLLMQSGLGDADELRGLGIPVVGHLPGVGRNFQDHPRIDCVWESSAPLEQRNNRAEVTVFWHRDPGSEAPDLQICVGEFPLASSENSARYGLPAHGFTMCAGVLRPRSRGRIRIAGPDPSDPVIIEANMLADGDDMRAAVACVQLCREIGNSAPLRPFIAREVMPGDLYGDDLEDFIRDGASSYWHQTGTAKMGRDDMAVVDGSLKVHGVEGLRIADGSVMPRVTGGNTMAPCVIIGERLGDILTAEHGLS